MAPGRGEGGGRRWSILSRSKNNAALWLKRIRSKFRARGLCLDVGHQVEFLSIFFREYKYDDDNDNNIVDAGFKATRIHRGSTG